MDFVIEELLVDVDFLDDLSQLTNDLESKILEMQENEDTEKTNIDDILLLTDQLHQILQRESSHRESHVIFLESMHDIEHNIAQKAQKFNFETDHAEHELILIAMLDDVKTANELVAPHIIETSNELDHHHEIAHQHLQSMFLNQTLFTISVISVTLFFLWILTSRILSSIGLLNRATKNPLDAKFSSSGISNIDELLELGKNFEVMQAQLLNYQHEKADFTTMITHELKNSLSPIVTACEMLADEKTLGKLTVNQKEEIQRISRNVKTLNKLISDIFDMQKFESRQFQLDSKEFLIGDFFRDIEADYQQIAKNNNIVFSIKFSDDVKVNSDPTRLRQIYDNLFQNSLDFVSDTTGIIDMGAKVQKNSVLFYLTDNGSGISNQNQKNIFDKFYQINPNQSRKYGGSGLGLYICKLLIEQLGGKIWIESELGVGTSMFFSIPRN